MGTYITFSFVKIFNPLTIMKDWKFYVVIKLYMPKVFLSMIESL